MKQEKKKGNPRAKKPSGRRSAPSKAPYAPPPIPRGWCRLAAGTRMETGDRICWPSCYDTEFVPVLGLVGVTVSDTELAIREVKRPKASPSRKARGSK